MKVIGIVGGIGSGKSYVAQRFAQLGAVVVDADRIAHEVLADPCVQKAIRDTFGRDIALPDGSIDRRALAQRVFAEGRGGEEALRQLEAITHPEIERRIRARLDELLAAGIAVAVLDAAIMIQTGWHRVCDVMIFVDADDQTRWQRVAERGWTRAEWRLRESRQTPLETARQLCDRVIFNGGQPAENVEEQVNSVWEWLGFRGTAVEGQPPRPTP